MEVPKFIKGVAKYFTYASDSGETTPTTQADLQELMKNNNTILECLVDGLWQPDKEMQLGQIVRSPNMPANTVAKVTSVGVTGTTEPEWPETVEATVSDGSVTFTMLTNVIVSYTKTETDAKLEDKADLVDGNLPMSQLPKLVVIPSNSDVNNYKTMGRYCCLSSETAKTIINIPINKFAFYLDVTVMTDNIIKQVFTNSQQSSPDVYIRTYYNGNWGSWKKVSSSNPVGTIIAVAYTGVPEGYMHCNGAAVNRTTYVNLFNEIGTTYGAGDGSTTFNLPNTVSKFLEGGVAAGTYYEAGLPNITGTLTGLAYRNNYYGVGTGVFSTSRSGGQSSLTLDGVANDLINFNATNSNSIYGASTTVQPPAMTVIYCIKY